MPHGLGWEVTRFGAQPLTGFAHGAAGVAWALLELADATGNDAYRNAARQALIYERSLYVAAEENWPDLRPAELIGNGNGAEPGAPHYMAAWCHGSTGIGLARLAALRRLEDAQLRDEAETAIRTTIGRGFGQTHSLCHGDMGNLDLLLEAGRVLGDGSWCAASTRLAASVVESIERDGWQCGGPAGVEMPALMLGVAGIGYQMLRLALPDQTPSVLLLAPPIAQPGTS
jgi:lantibiotic modifying enzyme